MGRPISDSKRYNVGDYVRGNKILSQNGERYNILCKICNKKFTRCYNWLNLGSLESCGCDKKQNEDYTGKTIGLLYIIGPGKSIVDKRGKSRRSWLCRCKCGKELEILRSKITSRQKQSCGCLINNKNKYNFIDLTGKRFSQLLVIKKIDEFTKSRGVLWECKCDCGNIINIPSNSLTSGNTKTCGNLLKHPKDTYTGEIPNSHINSIKQNAIKRKLEFSVDPEYLWKLFLQQDRKCKISGLELKFTKDHYPAKDRSNGTTASLDRINSDLGYVDNNVQWVHKDINRMKLQFSEKKFLELVQIIYRHQINQEKRPNWDEYFLSLAWQVSLRSDDKFIKHGAVIVNSSNRIIGTGYNNTVEGFKTDLIDVTNRDQRRPYMLHAEHNAILNCSQSLHLINTKIYITGIPCVNCIQTIINSGIKEIICINKVGTSTEDEKSKEMRDNLLYTNSIKIKYVDIDTQFLYYYYNKPFEELELQL